MRRRFFIAPPAVVALAFALAVTISSCGDDDGSTCKRVEAVPSPAACISLGVKLTCGVTTCGTTVTAADADACQALADASFCETDRFNSADGTCQLAGCPCDDFEGEELVCSLSGCRSCPFICGYELTEIPSVVECAAKAGEFECVSAISYDEFTATCTLVGCTVCGGAG
jgi:hypothetical protein